MSRQDNPFEDAEAATLDTGNPFSAPNSSNPFSHPNDSAFSVGSGGTARGNTYGAPKTQREIDLEAREAAVRDREQRVRADEARLGEHANNWPPYLPFKIVHHDLETIPQAYQFATKMLYYQWLALAATLILNLVGAILLLATGAPEGVADLGASIMYVPVIGVASFFLWYRPIYLGFRNKDTSGNAVAFFFYVYFIFAGFHLLYSAYMAVGIPSTGSAGLINTISSFIRGHIVAGVFGVLASVGWLVQALGGSIMYKLVWNFKNRDTAITFAEATQQFKRNSMKTILLHQAGMSS